ncbi:MAG: hypothetical protein JXR70_05820 [Spirochaetales bacterium]|nr:hypothetical protein [Spirochaetales bacterium]
MKTKQYISLFLILFLPISASSQLALSSALESEINHQDEWVLLPFAIEEMSFAAFNSLDRDLSFLNKSILALKLGLSDFSIGYSYFQELDLRNRYGFWGISPYLKLSGNQTQKNLFTLPDTWENHFALFLSYDTFTASIFFDPRLIWIKDDLQAEKLYFQGDTGFSFQSSAISFTTMKFSGKGDILNNQKTTSIGLEIENEILSGFDWLLGLSVYFFSSDYLETRSTQEIKPDSYLEIGISNKLTTVIDTLIWQLDIPFTFQKKYHSAIWKNNVLSQNEWVIVIEPKASLDFPILKGQNLIFTLSSDISISNSDILNHQGFSANIKYQYKF